MRQLFTALTIAGLASCSPPSHETEIPKTPAQIEAETQAVLQERLERQRRLQGNSPLAF